MEMMKKDKMISVSHFIAIAISFVYIYLVNSLQISIPEIAFFVVLLFLFSISNRRVIFFCIALSFMLELWFPFTFVVIAGALAIMMKNGNVFRVQNDTIFIAVFAFLQLFSTIMEGLDLLIWLKVALCLIAEVYLCKSIETQEEATEFSKGIIFGFLILAVVTLFYALQSVSLSSIILHFRLGSNTLEHWLANGVVIPNENNLARACVFSITVSFLLKEKKVISPIFYGIFDAFAIVILLLTQSRSGLFLLVAAYVFYYMLSSNKDFGKKAKALLGAGLIFGVVCIVLLQFMPNLLDVIGSRFQDEDLTNGRWDNAIYYHNVWISNIRWVLIGFGDQMVNTRFSHYNTVHSALQAYFVHYGIVGATAFFTFLITYVKNLSRKLIKPTPITAWLPFIVVCIGKLFGAMNTSELLMSAVLSMVYAKFEE